MVQAIRGFESHPLRFLSCPRLVKAEPARTPVVHVIAGPNGAGKTTFATQFLPKLVGCEQFLNADLIAAGLSPFAPETQRIRAGRLLLERMAELRAKRSDFGFETTLSGRGHAAHLREMKRSGFPTPTWP
jgi:predicted ABC-type ATPase